MFSKGDSVLECYFQMPNWSLHKYPILVFFPFFSPYPALILHSAHLLQPVEGELRLLGLIAGPGIHRELLLA